MTYPWNDDADEGDPMKHEKLKLILSLLAIVIVVVVALLMWGCETSTSPGTTVGGFTVSYADSVSIQVNDQSINAQSWRYEFGDGSGTSTERNPFHDYGPAAAIRGCTENEPCAYSINQTSCPGNTGDFDATSCQRASARVVIPEPRGAL